MTQSGTLATGSYNHTHTHCHTDTHRKRVCLHVFDPYLCLCLWYYSPELLYPLLQQTHTAGRAATSQSPVQSGNSEGRHMHAHTHSDSFQYVKCDGSLSRKRTFSLKRSDWKAYKGWLHGNRVAWREKQWRFQTERVNVIRSTPCQCFCVRAGWI